MCGRTTAQLTHTPLSHQVFSSRHISRPIKIFNIQIKKKTQQQNKIISQESENKQTK